MSGGTERGSWVLATGETVVAKVDEEGVESVYVDGRLVSRAPRGRMVAGHPVKGRGPAEGTYRSGRDARVFFDEGGCRLVVDGEAAPEGAEPTRPPKPLKKLEVALLFAVATISAALMVFVVQAPFQSCGAPRKPPPQRTRAPRPPVPITETYRATTVPVVVHHPKSFDVSERPVTPDNAVLTLRWHDGYGTLDIFADKKPDTFDLWKLDQLIQDAAQRSWAPRKIVVEGTERSDGTCVGERAAVAVRELKVGDLPVRQWSCTFLHHEHSYRFVTYTKRGHDDDQAYLRSIVEATEVF